MTDSGNSTSNKTWQYAFLTGIAFCIISTVFVFGASLLTTVLTVSTLIIGLACRDQPDFIRYFALLLRISKNNA